MHGGELDEKSSSSQPAMWPRDWLKTKTENGLLRTGTDGHIVQARLLTYNTDRNVKNNKNIDTVIVSLPGFVSEEQCDLWVAAAKAMDPEPQLADDVMDPVTGKVEGIDFVTSTKTDVDDKVCDGAFAQSAPRDG